MIAVILVIILSRTIWITSVFMLTWTNIKWQSPCDVWYSNVDECPPQSNVIDVFFGVRSAGDCQLSCVYHHRLGGISSLLSVTEYYLPQRLRGLHLVRLPALHLPPVLLPLLQVWCLEALDLFSVTLIWIVSRCDKAIQSEHSVTG